MTQQTGGSGLREWHGVIPVGQVIWHYYVREDSVVCWWPSLPRPYTDGEKVDQCDHDWEQVNPGVMDSHRCLKCGTWK